MARKLIIFTSLLVIWSAAAGAQTVRVEKDQIVLKTASGDDVPLTSSGRNSGPVLSPDRKQVAFVRTGPTPKYTSETAPGAPTEIWMVGVDGGQAELLVRSAPSKKMETLLADLCDLHFSPDGDLLYFESAAWATSHAVHVLNLAIRQERFFISGSLEDVVRSGRYRGCLLVNQHRYFIGGGSYDWIWLINPDETEVGPLGENSDNFRDSYMKGQPRPAKSE